MQKHKTKIGLLTILSVVTLASCKKDPRIKIEFWTGFGAAVNAVLTPLIAEFEEQNPDLRVDYQSKGGYDGLRQAIVQSVSNSKYPHIANGYPDHFADYANSNVLLDLNTSRYIKNEDPEIGVNIDDYLANYMVENTTLIDKQTTGLPFNKSTEIMVTNQSFFDVAKIFDPEVKVPETWQELAVVGVKLKAIYKDKKWGGKYILKDGTAVGKDNLTEAQEAQVAIDLTNLKDDTKFIPFSWDSASNFFITILRQWDSAYTERGDTFHTGKILFQTPTYLPKTLEALSYFQKLAEDGIVGIPATFGESQYSSNPFKQGKVALTISSSAGVKENLPTSITDYPFDVTINPIPYNANHPEKRYVISQGTNLALFRKGNLAKEKDLIAREGAWKLLRFLTYEVNHRFGLGTSYFPVTDGSRLEESDPRYADYKLYKDLLEKTGGTVGEVATRNTAKLQAEVYQAKDEETGKQIWTQFVDPGFIGSSGVRLEIEKIMGKLFTGSEPQKVIDDAVNQLKDFT